MLRWRVAGREMRDATASWLYVLGQFGLLALLPVLPPWHWTWHPLGAALLALSLLLGTWTLLYNRPGNFNVRPQPHEGGHLVMGGPYRFVRHPMYVSVLLGAAGWALCAGGWLRAVVVALLVLVLDGKARFEERLLSRRWPGYAGYRARTARFLPWLW